jgi:hypothetical protein
VAKTIRINDRLIKIFGQEKAVQLALTKHALEEAKLGNTLLLFSAAIGSCSLGDAERDEITNGLVEYHRPDMVRRVEKILIAYWRGNLRAEGWPATAATQKVVEVFGRSHGFVCEAIRNNKKRGGVFAL